MDLNGLVLGSLFIYKLSTVKIEMLTLSNNEITINNQ